MPEALIDRARSSRKSPSVLKMRLSNFRSKERFVPVFVLEGTDDLGPFEVWVARIDGRLRYEPLPAQGKEQVLAFRRLLASDTIGLAANVFFFVDRDFDYLQDEPEGPDLFCTAEYSIENVLAAESVLESILRDEFRCALEISDRQRAVDCFRAARGSFLEIMRAANLRILTARKSGIRIERAEHNLTRYVTVGIRQSECCYCESDLKALIQLEREPTDEEMERAKRELDALEPAAACRGKFLLEFFAKWVRLLAADRESPKPTVFSATVRLALRDGMLTLRSLATRSELPRGLPEFLSQVPRVP